MEAVLLFLVLFFPAYLAQLRGGAPSSDAAAAMVDAMVVGVPQIALLLFLVRPEPAERYGLRRPVASDAGAALVAWLGGLAILALLAGGMNLIGPLRSLASRGTRWRLASIAQLPLAFAGSIATGYREELYFRSYLFARLEDAGVGRGWAAAASVALFTLGHLYEGPLGAVVAACLGAWFTAVYLRTGSLHVVAAAHGLWNAAVLAVGLLAPGLPPAH